MHFTLLVPKENFSRDNFEMQTATGRRMKIVLTHFDANVLTMRSSFYDFKPNFANQKGLVRNRSESF